MKLTCYTVITIVLLLVIPLMATGQPWPFNKRGQAEKATRDLNKREQIANEGNAFNPLQPMGARSQTDRDDYLWSSETAYTALFKTGNLSLTTPSRLGINNQFELSAILPASYWIPNLMIKKSHFNRQFLLATRHGIYSATPGLKWAQKQDYQSIVNPLVKVPNVLAIRNELIVSKPFGMNEGCSIGKPYLIITAGAALDWGLSPENNQLYHVNEHLLGSRSPALTGQGILISGRLRADAVLNSYMLIEGGVKFFHGNFYGNKAFEHHAGLQNFISRNISVTLGYILSAGDFSNSKVKLYPSFDCTWYFGAKPGRPKGLFDRKMR